MFDDEVLPSFSPDLKHSKKFAKVESNYGQTNLIMQNIAEKAHAKRMKIEEIRKERDEEEMKECSFTPKPRTLKTSQSCTDVRGLERFLHLKSMAEKKKAEQRQREAKVFNLNPSLDAKRITVPVPFELHTSRAEGKQAKTHRKHSEKHAQLLKFRASLTSR
mmetsp:Transcript_33273/g.58379  ORF Transcript_33273/g.58379 Transcript_33273/m.58379 type:complete len:162 (-) Transcript_33273:643-1128(-)|eukprot:CAMPEP_0204909902 /NCGR_PEP_ID=MMETSP1397-20131031/8521_1 /ASSEMBLY_ACC=CAM_ASM_000891 /TAXON_ID=49980 /ORGANISM="Climacostomum Climacostomum virens, Strain Stock W-24" /LENGTH=161 /DNA_ID=CAMNT_0052079863 /DNA_START=895 /DNA_END=1380 /DNA_ORIENTATION=-